MNENINWKIFRWMRTKLHLKSFAKELFAIIYSLTKNGGETFATNAYFAEELDCSVKKVSDTLRKFTEEGIICKRSERERNGGEINHYHVNMEKLDELGIVPVFLADSEKKSHTPMRKKFSGGSEKNSTPTIIYNSTAYNSMYDKPLTDGQTEKFGKYKNVRLNTESFNELKKRFGEQLDITLESFSAFLARNPRAFRKSKKSHQEVLTEWCTQDMQKSGFSQINSSHICEKTLQTSNEFYEMLKAEGYVS